MGSKIRCRLINLRNLIFDAWNLSWKTQQSLYLNLRDIDKHIHIGYIIYVYLYGYVWILKHIKHCIFEFLLCLYWISLFYIFPTCIFFLVFTLKLIPFVLRDKVVGLFFLSAVPVEDNLMLITACQSEDC